MEAFRLEGNTTVRAQIGATSLLNWMLLNIAAEPLCIWACHIAYRPIISTGCPVDEIMRLGNHGPQGTGREPFHWFLLIVTAETISTHRRIFCLSFPASLPERSSAVAREKKSWLAKLFWLGSRFYSSNVGLRGVTFHPLPAGLRASCGRW